MGAEPARIIDMLTANRSIGQTVKARAASRDTHAGRVNRFVRDQLRDAPSGHRQGAAPEDGTDHGRGSQHPGPARQAGVCEG